MGRPRVYEGAGAPILQVRLTPALLEQVRARGGSAWVRGLIEEACEGPEESKGVTIVSSVVPSLCLP